MKFVYSFFIGFGISWIVTGVQRHCSWMYITGAVITAAAIVYLCTGDRR